MPAAGQEHPARLRVGDEVEVALAVALSWSVRPCHFSGNGRSALASTVRRSALDRQLAGPRPEQHPFDAPEVPEVQVVDQGERLLPQHVPPQVRLQATVPVGEVDERRLAVAPHRGDAAAHPHPLGAALQGRRVGALEARHDLADTPVHRESAPGRGPPPAPAALPAWRAGWLAAALLPPHALLASAHAEAAHFITERASDRYAYTSPVNTPSERAPSTLFSHHIFDDFELPEPVRAGLRDAGFTHCTLVQAEVLPLTLAGRDVAAQAQTGTGKTAAYLVTIFKRLLSHAPARAARRRARSSSRPRASWSCRSRTTPRSSGVHTGLDHRGGVRRHRLPRPARRAARRRRHPRRHARAPASTTCEQGVDLAPATSRSSSSTRPTACSTWGSSTTCAASLRRLPPPGKRQTMFFTATLSPRVLEPRLRATCTTRRRSSVNPEELTADRLEQVLYHVGAPREVLAAARPAGARGLRAHHVFVNTREEARRLVERLERHGYDARGLTGYVIQRSRLKVLEDFKDGKPAACWSPPTWPRAACTSRA